MMSSKSQPPSTECTQVQEAILALLDDELTPDQQRLLAQHLPVCPACQAYQRSMGYLTLSLRQLDALPVPNGLENRIMTRLAAEKEAGNRMLSWSAAPSRRSTFLKKYVPIAAAVLFVALALPWMAQNLNFQGESQSASVGSTRSVDQPQTVARGPAVNPVHYTPVPETNSTQTNRQLASASNLPVSTPMKSGASQPLASTAPSTRQTLVASKSLKVQPEPASPEVTSVDSRLPNGSEVASALPSSLNLDSTYASTNDSDVYYDPVSNLVQF